ncbi:MAG: 23S rRNA pseudouridine(1911/1915/1917) synthase RluD [Gammaproteobacteria bacterium]|nr:MAG: 23S rRNA pseudouridine(1911/1915/1917) synthase RluD [Gammaproteobacteria bacterium]
MIEPIVLNATVPESLAGARLDQVAAELFSSYSRSRLQKWIKEGDLLVDGKSCRPKDKLFGGEQLSVRAELEPEGEWSAEPIELEIVYEDEHLLVINKPAGLVVHPAVGNQQGTLLNGLLHHLPDNENLPRAGIVHRLDKDTSGLMVVAKSLVAHQSLIKQLQARTVSREYLAVVQGVMTGGGTVDKPMGRHPQSRTKMAVVDFGGKEAVTHYRVVERFPGHTLIRVKLETGRTHQIRVHMASIGYPLIGDATYGGRLKLPKGATPELHDALRGFKRQALHAARLALIHPASGEDMEWQALPPDDFNQLLMDLKTDAKNRQ